ncbi:hypothetical protein [Shewanella sp. T24-MNA-CIBAN-0130]|uniref:hypothetical protein n=1 Tax=Shewanella sp. T24-MNA-CIBAN-0130 TaxID=3140470 RepID=UPI0033306E24
MNLPQALSMSASHKLTVLLPVKMGFFLIIRTTKSLYSKPSISRRLMEKYQINGLDTFECNIVEVDANGRKIIKEIQKDWLQWAVTENDINNPNFLVM